jgi:hypothetical protein
MNHFEQEHFGFFLPRFKARETMLYLSTKAYGDCFSIANCRISEINKSRIHQLFRTRTYSFSIKADEIEINEPNIMVNDQELHSWLIDNVTGSCRYHAHHFAYKDNVFSTKFVRISFSSERDATLFRMIFDATPDEDA